MADCNIPKGRMAVTGMFDGVHAGHLSLLEQARREARRRGLSLMAVTFARHPLEEVAPERAPQLLMTADRREQMLRAVADEVIVLDFTPQLRALTMEEFMCKLRDDFGARAIFMGYNHRFGSDRVTDPALYREAGRRLGLDVVTGSEEQVGGSKVSSSVIRRHIAEGRVKEGAELLGRYYSIEGTVGPGRQIGRTIGFPTANLIPAEPRQLVPATGVYACRVRLDDGRLFGGMANIGTAPTVSTDGRRTIEVNLFDFSGDLYGRRIEVEFIDRMRDERRFPNLEALTAQLRADARHARRILAG